MKDIWNNFAQQIGDRMNQRNDQMNNNIAALMQQQTNMMRMFMEQSQQRCHQPPQPTVSNQQTQSHQETESPAQERGDSNHSNSTCNR